VLLTTTTVSSSARVITIDHCEISFNAIQAGSDYSFHATYISP
jgi:hypothetical protein